MGDKFHVVDLRHVKEPYRAWVRCFVGQISWPLFLTRDILLLRYQMALVVESGWFETMLGQQVSHLLLKYTKSGYETVLTAACASQGCSATE
jgi:hypothetical protein